MADQFENNAVFRYPYHEATDQMLRLLSFSIHLWCAHVVCVVDKLV